MIEGYVQNVEAAYDTGAPEGSFSDESTAFIGDKVPASQSRWVPDKSQHSRIRILSSAFPWALSTVLAIALLLQSHVQFQQSRTCAEDGLERYSPAGEAIRYQDVQFHRAFGDEGSSHLSPYQGWPSDEKDKLWKDMYAKGILIGIDSESHSHLLNSSERVPQKGQTDKFMVGLDVFHQLHCLDMMRKSIYPKRYNMSLARADGTVDYGHWMHVDHCVESLRQSLTCSADVAAYSYDWLDEAKMMMARIGGLHHCRDFSAIQDWAFARHVDPESMRARVEGQGESDTRIVDYSAEFDYRTKPWAPPGWYHTVDEL